MIGLGACRLPEPPEPLDLRWYSRGREWCTWHSTIEMPAGTTEEQRAAIAEAVKTSDVSLVGDLWSGGDVEIAGVKCTASTVNFSRSDDSETQDYYVGCIDGEETGQDFPDDPAQTVYWLTIFRNWESVTHVDGSARMMCDRFASLIEETEATWEDDQKAMAYRLAVEADDLQQIIAVWQEACPQFEGGLVTFGRVEV